MQNSYHATIINLSQNNLDIFKRFSILEIKKRFAGLLKIYKVTVPQDDIQEAISITQKNMSSKLLMFRKEWYATFYNSESVIIVFREKVYHLSARGIVPTYQQVLDTTNAEDEEQWNEMIDYGKSLGIPVSQLDFLPLNFHEETF